MAEVAWIGPIPWAGIDPWATVHGRNIRVDYGPPRTRAVTVAVRTRRLEVELV